MSEKATHDITLQIIDSRKSSQHIKRLLDKYDNDTDAIVSDAYFVSGGVIGQIETFLMNGTMRETYDMRKMVASLVKHVSSCIANQPAGERSQQRRNALYMTPMSRKGVMAAEPDVEIQDLYEAADRNHIIYDDDVTDMVQFKSPCVAALLLVEDDGDEGWLTLELKTWLANLSSSNCSYAEEVVRRAMADKLKRDQGKANAVLKAGKSLEDWAVHGDCDVDGLDCYIFKEEPDMFGADATWFEKTNDGMLRMVRCQIKLGNSKMSYGVLGKDNELPTSIDDKFDFKTNKFSSHAIAKLALWSDHFRELCKQEKEGLFQRHKVTSVTSLFVFTRPLAKEETVRALATKKNVELWDKRHLAENLWPPYMLAWAKRCKLDMYYIDDGGEDS